MKIKSFECPKSIRNYKKATLGTSDTWLTSHLSQETSVPTYYIVDCQICRITKDQLTRDISFACCKNSFHAQLTIHSGLIVLRLYTTSLIKAIQEIR